MPKEGIFKELRPVVYSLMDRRGNFRTLPIGNWKNKPLSEDRLRLMQTFLKLLFETDIICAESKLYISDLSITISTVNFLMQDRSENPDKVYNYKTTANKIYYDQRKLAEIFGKDIVYDVMWSNNPIDKYITAISKVMCDKGAGKELRDLLTLDLDDYVIASECSSESFADFLVAIKPYTKAVMENVCNQLPKEAIGYFNYLISAPSLSDSDTANKTLLIQILNNTYTSDDENNVD